MNYEQLKLEFINLLRSTKREGMENVIEELSKTDFFTAPASSRYHEAYKHGLLQHCMEVYNQLRLLVYIESKKINEDIAISDDSVTIVSLLHDVCKINSYEWAFIKNAKNEKGEWYEKFDWKKRTPELPVGHGERSVILLLRWGLKLTDEEICAIRWHMGAFDMSQYSDVRNAFNEAGNMYHLVPLLQSADMLASRVTPNTGATAKKVQEQI